MLDLNAVLRMMPQKVSLQVENSNSVSRVKLELAAHMVERDR